MAYIISKFDGRGLKGAWAAIGMNMVHPVWFAHTLYNVNMVCITSRVVTKPVGSNRYSVKLTGTHRNFKPYQLALEWQIYLSIPQNSHKMPLLKYSTLIQILIKFNGTKFWLVTTLVTSISVIPHWTIFWHFIFG